MQTFRKFKYLTGVYLATLGLLAISVSAMPFLIRHDVSFTREIVIGEETLETSLIVVLLGISFLTFRAFKHTLKNYRHLLACAGQDKSRLASRLSDAFSYIGTVNVEFKEIQSIVCGIDRYPRTKKEFKDLLVRLAEKAMAVSATPWAVIRLIDLASGRTIKECAAQRRQGLLPSSTAGNRAILEGRRTDGVRTVVKRQPDLDLATACILPEARLSEETIVMITAILNQVEVVFLVNRSGCLRPNQSGGCRHRENNHDPHTPHPSHAGPFSHCPLDRS